MDKLIKLLDAIEEIDVSASDLAGIFADVIIKDYGTHNYEAVKQVINEKLS